MQTSTAPPLVEPAWVIWFDGRAYHYRQYSYDLLPDAIAYARLDRAKPGFHDEPLPRYWKQWQGPTPEETAQMAPHGIGYERGRYYYGPYRYELLADALAYAKRSRDRTSSQG
jgi:hypothetical protein